MSDRGATALRTLLGGDRGVHIDGQRDAGHGPTLDLRSPANGGRGSRPRSILVGNMG